MNRLAFASLGALFVLGCARNGPMMDDTLGEGYFFVSGRFYDKPYADVFEALKARLMKKGYSLIRADKNMGVITTSSRPLEGMEYMACACPKPQAFRELGRKVKMTFVITEIAAERTQITVRSRFTSYWSDGRSTVERSCSSDGKLERDILRF